VIGAGGWGTTLAIHLARRGHDAWLWGRDAALVAEMRARRSNAVYLPDVSFPPGLEVTADLEEALHAADIIVSAVPTHGTRTILKRLTPYVRPGSIVVSATKGLEQGTLFRVSEIVTQELGDGVQVVALSGPSFAAEVARELPNRAVGRLAAARRCAARAVRVSVVVPAAVWNRRCRWR
jgi:glycerol-3-phosphate dehydrogenase (NAD(P)+)